MNLARVMFNKQNALLDRGEFMTNVNYVILSGSIIVNFEGATHNVASSDGRYAKILSAIKAGKLSEIPNLVDTTLALRQGGVDVRNGVVFIDNKALPDSLSDRILQFFHESLPYEPLIKFWRKLNKNPSFNSREQLFKFLEHNGHPITTEGNFIAYRSVRRNFTDHHTGKMDNSIGRVVEVDRSDVDDNPNNTCSHGLHVACLSYAASFGGDRILIDVEVDPADVVAVPTDYNGTKMRVSRFKVVAESKGLRTETLAKSSYDISTHSLNIDDSCEDNEYCMGCDDGILDGDDYCGHCGKEF
jgi:hypothetical protein